MTETIQAKICAWAMAAAAIALGVVTFFAIDIATHRPTVQPQLAVTPIPAAMTTREPSDPWVDWLTVQARANNWDEALAIYKTHVAEEGARELLTAPPKVDESDAGPARYVSLGYSSIGVRSFGTVGYSFAVPPLLMPRAALFTPNLYAFPSSRRPNPFSSTSSFRLR